jgi:hypothetical protein
MHELETLDLDQSKLTDKGALLIAKHIALKHLMISNFSNDLDKNHLKAETI